MVWFSLGGASHSKLRNIKHDDFSVNSDEDKCSFINQSYRKALFILLISYLSCKYISQPNFIYKIFFIAFNNLYYEDVKMVILSLIDNYYYKHIANLLTTCAETLLLLYTIT